MPHASGASSPHYREMVLAVGAAVLALVLGLAGVNPHLPGGGDNADYIAEAQALLARGERVLIHTAGEPPAFRPPMLSVLLSGVIRVMGRDVAAMKALLVAFAAGAVLAAWWALREALTPVRTDKKSSAPEHTPAATAAGIAVWFALAPVLMFTAHDVLSDVPFTFFMLVALGFLGRFVRPETSAWNLAGAMLALAACASLRSAALFPATAGAAYLAIEWYFERQSPRAGRLLRGTVLTLVFTTGLAAYVFWNASAYMTMLSAGSAQGAATDLSGSLLERVWRSLHYYLSFLPGEVAACRDFWPYQPLVLLGLALTICGSLSLLRRGLWLAPLTYGVYLAGLALWPGVEPRLYLPILPLFMLLMLEGARSILIWAARKAPWCAVLAGYMIALCPAVSLTSIVFGWLGSEAQGVVDSDWITAALLLAFAAGLVAWVLARKVAAEAWESRGVKAWLGFAACFFLLLVAVRTMQENIREERMRGPAPKGPGWSELYEASVWLKEHAPPGDVVMSAKVSLVWFWSSRQGVQIPAIRQVPEFLKTLNRAQWAIVDQLEEDRIAARYLEPILDLRMESWAVAWEKNGTRVYRRTEVPAP